MDEIICRGKRDGVTKSDIATCLDRFATLATRLDFPNVATFSLENHACHGCHAEKENVSENHLAYSPFVGSKALFAWLVIAMEEGHLEPSQQVVGRAIGWPQREINKRSLWVEFITWCHKQNISKKEIPEQWAVYEALDKLFIGKGDKYEFPPLELCRSNFFNLRKQCECD